LVAACGVFANPADHAGDYYHELILNGENPSGLPEWIVSVEHEFGVWLEQPNRWVAERALPDGHGRILISIDRKMLHSDVGMSLICEEDHDADIAVQLLDREGRVIAVDLVGNAISIGDETQTNTFAIPLRKHPTATRIVIQRISGHITIHGVVLFPLVIGDANETDLIAQIDMLQLLKQSLSPNSPTLQTITQIMKEKNSTDADVPPADHVEFRSKPSSNDNAFEPSRLFEVPNASKTVGMNKRTIIEVEAEDYTTCSIKGQHYWMTIKTESPTHLLAYPGRNKVFDRSTIEDSAPVLQYKIYFADAGKYYLWVRGKGRAGGASIIPGFNGTRLTPTSDYFGYFPRHFGWLSGLRKSNTRAVIEVSEAGEHSVTFWMREDSFRFDKFLITSDPAHIPE
jgi:hypothetical protein